MRSLPHIMVAPNGARRGKKDHPAIPVTIAEIVATARDCLAAGAGGIHAHVRDEQENHVLDGGLYRELIAELSKEVPAMLVQITTEAVGRYSPAEQRSVVRAVMPSAVSVGLNELVGDGDLPAARDFYHWAAEASIAVQHILYTPDDVERFLDFRYQGVIPNGAAQLLFVLGRYAANQESSPADLEPFLNVLTRSQENDDWAVCAFGRNETHCLDAARTAGGKARIGFENSLWNADGTIASNNAERVKELAALFSCG